jgi:hypothetical protein
MSGRGSRGWETSAAAMPAASGNAERTVIETFLAGMQYAKVIFSQESHSVVCTVYFELDRPFYFRCLSLGMIPATNRHIFL